MSQPRRREQSTPGNTEPGDPAAQIERLLVSGLDHYFAGHHQEAIDVWTRVVFLERGNRRARAYIERARSAIAEQERHADELVQRGRLAYESGAIADARRWLDEALERSPSSDEAVALQQQVDRFSAAATPIRYTEPATPSSAPRADRWSVALWGLAVVSLLALVGAPLASRYGGGPVANQIPAAVVAPPVPRIGVETRARAERWMSEGRWHDALRALSAIDLGDPSYAQARALSGDIQQRLLGAARQSREQSSTRSPR